MAPRSVKFTPDILLALDDEQLLALAASDPDALCEVCRVLLVEYKVLVERLEQNPNNSSTPSGSMPPWASNTANSADADADAGEGEEPLADHELSGDEHDADTASSTPGPLPREEPNRKPGRQPGAQGFGRTQKLPVTATEHHHCHQCVSCGADLRSCVQVAYTAFYTLDVAFGSDEKPGLHLSNTCHRLYQALCPSCGTESRNEPHRARDTGDEWDAVELTSWRLIGPGLASLIVYLAMEMRMSRRMTVRLLADVLGLCLSTGSVQNCIDESARALAPIEEQLVQDLLNDDLLHVDETPHKEAGALLWLWAFVSKTTALFYVGSRSSEIFRNLINAGYLPFAGWLMTDGYLVYREFVKRLRCWAHLIRKAEGLSECYTTQSRQQGSEVLETLHTLMAAVYQAREGPPNHKPASIAADHEKLLAKLRKTCEAMSCSSHKKTHALGVEFLRDWDAIFRVLEHPHLPLTNNEAERILRHWVIMRRLTQGTRTELGSRVLALYASVFATCRLRQVGPLRYVESVIRARRSGEDAPPLPMGQSRSI